MGDEYSYEFIAQGVEDLLVTGDVEPAGKNEKGEQLWQLSLKGRMKRSRSSLPVDLSSE